MMPHQAIAMGWQYLQSGNAAAAEAAVRPLMATGVNADLVPLLGAIRLQQGRCSEAAPLFEQARKLHPATGRFAYFHGAALAGMNQLDAAVAAYQAAIKQEPDFADTYLALGQVQRNSGRAEEALKNALEKEKELGELKSRFVSIASHEFRTPLATILATAETLSAYRSKLGENQIQEKLNKISDQVIYLKSIIEDTLQVARLRDPKSKFEPESLDLDAVCQSAIDEFESRPEVTQQFVYSYDTKLHQAQLDRKLIRQIINNLLSNAAKYSAPDTTIRVTLERIDESLMLKVQDEGIGIPEADLKHLFEPFHRAANVGLIPGTGLGLVITKESVELHGGLITVESKVGVGTTFTIMIPLQ